MRGVRREGGGYGVELGWLWDSVAVCAMVGVEMVGFRRQWLLKL